MRALLYSIRNCIGGHKDVAFLEWPLRRRLPKPDPSLVAMQIQT